jgi:hypothetical protein
VNSPQPFPPSRSTRTDFGTNSALRLKMEGGPEELVWGRVCSKRLPHLRLGYDRHPAGQGNGNVARRAGVTVALIVVPSIDVTRNASGFVQNRGVTHKVRFLSKRLPYALRSLSWQAPGRGLSRQRSRWRKTTAARMVIRDREQGSGLPGRRTGNSIRSHPGRAQNSPNFSPNCAPQGLRMLLCARRTPLKKRAPCLRTRLRLPMLYCP